MDINTAMLLSNLPKLDLHGYDRDTASLAINDFINDSIIQGFQYVKIIHGIGTGVIMNTTYEVLKKNKKVLQFKSYYNNRGCVIIELFRNN